MNAAQIKDEIRNLNRIEKMEIFRWIDQEVAEDLVWRIGMERWRQIRREFELRCNTLSPERQAAWEDSLKSHGTEQDSFDYAD
jgi:hypothetical protein